MPINTLRQHADRDIEIHAANCSQCLDATERYNHATMQRIGYSAKGVWLDMIDTLHNWQSRQPETAATVQK
jgi:hypothetical protein